MSTPGSPPLTSRRVHLRSITPNDYDYLYALTTNEHVNSRWRFRGTSPNPDQFAQLLWQNALAQFIVEYRESGQPIGYLSAFDANERNGWCHISVLIDPGLSHTGWALESFALFFNYLFETFNMRKLYGEVLQPAFDDLASGAGTWFRVEGRLVDHEYYGGQFCDLILLALHRDDWNVHGKPLIAKLVERTS